MMDVFILHAAADVATARALAQALAGHGMVARCQGDIEAQPGVEDDELGQVVAMAPLVLVLWSRDAVQDRGVQGLAWQALARHVLMPLRLDEFEAPHGFATLHTLSLMDWDGNPLHGACREVVGQVHQRWRAERGERLATVPAPAPALPSAPPTLPAPFPSPAPGASRGGGIGGWGRQAGAWADQVGDWWRERGQRRSARRPARETTDASGPQAGTWDEVLSRVRPPPMPRPTPLPPTAPPGATPSESRSAPADEGPLAPAADALSDPVCLGAAAPRQAAPGEVFVARLAVYVATARQQARQALVAAGEPGDRLIEDWPVQGDARWRLNAPITVRLLGGGWTPAPAERQFLWNGQQHLAWFQVTVPPQATVGMAQVLEFMVLLAGVPVATVPLRVTVVASTPLATLAPPLALQARQERPLPRALFASYASRDAVDVAERLSTLHRFAPGLDIFQDCLDLRANDHFKPQLEQEIRRRDTFVLFWSRHAAASTWVRWELQTACAAHGPGAVLPMPLEDPALAPPPPELAERHWRDRFMMAGLAHQKIADLRAGLPALPTGG